MPITVGLMVILMRSEVVKLVSEQIGGQGGQQELKEIKHYDYDYDL